MKIGVSLNPKSPEVMRECARAVESAGLDVLAHPDSQVIDREAYTTLAISAMETQTPQLAVIASNPVTRHITVIASAIATIDEVSNGRAILGMCTGGSAVNITELRPASLDTLGSAVNSIRELLENGQTEWQGATSRLNWADRDIPIFIATTGPKTLQMGGRIADGVIYSGRNPIDWAIEQVKEGATAAGRDLTDVEFWVQKRSDVADSRDKAIDSLRHSMAGTVHSLVEHNALDGIPDGVVERMKAFNEEYRPEFYNTYDTPHNADLIDAYDLREFVEDLAIAGTPNDVIHELTEYDEAGVDGVILMPRHDHPVTMINRLGADVIPAI